MTFFRPSSPRLIAVLVTALGLAAFPVAAVDYAITISDDNDSTNGDCSLREALYAATLNAARDACPAGSPTAVDRITLVSDVTFDGGMFYMNNVLGGELVIQGSTPVPTDTVINLFFSNRFLYLLNGDPVTVKDVQILFGEANAPRYGGIIRSGGTSLTLDNVALGLSSAEFGGAVSFLTVGGDDWLHIDGCTIAGNSVDGQYGGGLWVDVAGATEVQITNSTISGNSVVPANGYQGQGGGAWIMAGENSSVAIKNSLFDNNSGETDNWNRGAGLYLETEGFATAEVHDTVFSNNHWDYDIPTDWDGTDAANLLVRVDSTIALERCVFTNNRSPNTDDPTQLSVSVEDNASAIVASCLFTGGAWAAHAYNGDTATVYLTHLTVVDNEKSVWVSRSGSGEGQLNNSILSRNDFNLPTIYGGATSLDNFVGGDPLFEDPTNGDYHLMATSTAIDNGNQTRPGVRNSDLDRSPRVFAAETDQGAYEWGWRIFADGFENGDTNDW